MSGKKVNEIPFMSIPNMDKVAHFGMYFIMTFLLLFDFSRYNSKNKPWNKIIILSLLIAVVFGGSMELLQEIPSLQRSTDIKDFLANSTGAICAALSFKYLESLVNKITAIFIKPGNNYSL
jgi:VanZ family protein